MAAPRRTIPRRGGAVQRAPSAQPRPGSRRRYQRLAAGSLIVAPLVLLAGELLHPPFQRDPARLLAVAAANPGRWYLAHLLSLIGFALLMPAILRLTQLVGQGRAALADVGGTLALLGMLAVSGLLSIDGFGVWQMAQPAADRAEMAALLDRILTSPGVLTLYLVSLASAVGLLVLVVGLYRAQLVPAWTAGLVAIGVAVWFTGEAAANKATMVAGVTILALGLGLTGRRMLSASTQQPPEATTMTTPTPTTHSAQAATGQSLTPAEQAKALLRRLIEEVVNQGRLEVTDELFSPELAAAARESDAAFRAAFSDWHMELVDLVAEDDKVVGRFRCSGTHTGPWLGIAATGRRFEQVDEVAILRVQDGRFVDYWALEDTAGRLRQLDRSLPS